MYVHGSSCTYPMYACILMLARARLKDRGILWQAYQSAPFSPFDFLFSFFLPISSGQQSSRSSFKEYQISRWPQYASKDSRIFFYFSIPLPLLLNTDISGPLRPRSAFLGYKVQHHVPLGHLVWTRLMGSSAKEHCLTVYILSYRVPCAVLSTEISVCLRLVSLSYNHATKSSLYTV